MAEPQTTAERHATHHWERMEWAEDSVILTREERLQKLANRLAATSRDDGPEIAFLIERAKELANDQ